MDATCLNSVPGTPGQGEQNISIGQHSIQRGIRHSERYVGDRDMERLEAENAPVYVPTEL